MAQYKSRSSGGTTPPVVIDATGLTTTVPITIKNAKTGSGVEVQVTGTATSGYSLLNSSGTTKGGVHLIGTAGDEITGSAAGDVTITGDATKKLLIGALAGAAAMVTLDLSNGLLGINVTPSAARLDVADPGTSNTMARFKATTASGGVCTVSLFGSVSQGINMQAFGGSGQPTLFGVSMNSAVAFRANANVNFFVVGCDSVTPLLLATNNLERLRIDGAGNVSVGTAALTTGATDGFFYIPTCAGTPSGTPTSKTGLVPMIYDTTNNKFYIFNGAWKGGTNPGAFT